MPFYKNPYSKINVVNNKKWERNQPPAYIIKETMVKPENSTQQPKSEEKSSKPTTSTNNKFPESLQLASWNVRGCTDTHKQNEIDRILLSRNVDIACLQETQLGDDSIKTANYEWNIISKSQDDLVQEGIAILVQKKCKNFVSSFDAVTDNIVSCNVNISNENVILLSAHILADNEDDEFECLEQYMKMNNQKNTIVLGDFNAEIGSDDVENVDWAFVGQNLFHRKNNQNGRKLLKLARNAKYKIQTTWDEVSSIKSTSCRNGTEAQIDHVLTPSMKERVRIERICNYKEKGINTDHTIMLVQISINDSNAKKDVIPRPRINYQIPRKRTLEQRLAQKRKLADEQRVTYTKRLMTNDQISNASDDSKRAVEIPKQPKLSQTNHIDNAKGLIVPISNIKNEIRIQPGEPVPPGFENEVKQIAELKYSIDKCTKKPLIGLEYVIELNMGEGKDLNYLCVLCREHCLCSTIMNHITSYEHRLKYLEKHFKTAFQSMLPYLTWRQSELVLPEIIEKICNTIEDCYGRLVPSVYDNSEFNKHRETYVQQIKDDRHIEETRNQLIDNMIDHQAIRNSFATLNIKQSPATDTKSIKPFFNATKLTEEMRKEIEINDARNEMRKCWDDNKSKNYRSNRKFNVMNVMQLSRDRYTWKKNPNEATQRCKEPDVKTVKTNNRSSTEKSRSTSLADGRHSNIQSIKDKKEDKPPISKERVYIDQFTYDKYQITLNKITKELEKLLKNYKASPNDHPLYTDEWNRFWRQRSDELEKDNKDPYSYDLTAEWATYWPRRILEIHNNDVQKKKLELKKTLNIPDVYRVREPSQKLEETISSSVIEDKPTADTTTIINNVKPNEIVYRNPTPPPSLKPSTDPSLLDILRQKLNVQRQELVATTTIVPTKNDEHVEPNKKTTIPKRKILQHDPISDSDDETDDEVLTVISVLRLLAAFEDFLGSLGPRIVDLLSKAIALEKVKPNLADDLLMTEENSVLMETVKEKLRGLILAGIIQRPTLKPVKKSIRNVDRISKLIDEKVKQSKLNKEIKALMPIVKPTITVPQPAELPVPLPVPPPLPVKKTLDMDSKESVSKQIATSLLLQGKIISTHQLNQLTDNYMKTHGPMDTPYLYGLKIGSTLSTMDIEPLANFGKTQLQSTADGSSEYSSNQSMDQVSNFNSEFSFVDTFNKSVSDRERMLNNNIGDVINPPPNPYQRDLLCPPSTFHKQFDLFQQNQQLAIGRPNQNQRQRRKNQRQPPKHPNHNRSQTNMTFGDNCNITKEPVNFQQGNIVSNPIGTNASNQMESTYNQYSLDAQLNGPVGVVEANNWNKQSTSIMQQHTGYQIVHQQRYNQMMQKRQLHQSQLRNNIEINTNTKN